MNYIFCFTDNGEKTAKRIEKYICESFAQAIRIRVSEENRDYAKECIRNAFSEKNQECSRLIFVGACGIAVRYIAPFVHDKFSDPCVIVVDERGEFVIPLLSGHVGGANETAAKLAAALLAKAVITTATDINECFSVDVYAKKKGYILSDRALAKKVSAEILAKRQVKVLGAWDEKKLPDGLSYLKKQGKSCEECVKIAISNRRYAAEKNVLYLIPRTLHLGIGCKKGTDGKGLWQFVKELLDEHLILPDAIADISTIDIKKDEKAILELSDFLASKLIFYSANELMGIEGDFEASEFVLSTTGADNVCERSASLSARGGKRVIKKTSRDGMTAALYEELL